MLTFYLTAIESNADKKTFEYYYVTYCKQMLNVAYSVLHDKNNAEDAVHNAFVGLAKHIDVLTEADEKNGRNYVLKAAKNAALNIARSNRRTNEVDIEELYDIPDTSVVQASDNSGYNELVEAVRSLDSIYADVLYMHYVMDMTAKQIADVTGRKISAVKQQLVRGKKKLIEKLALGGDDRNEE